MIKPAFSTVACPEWTLERVALAAQRLGFAGVELRTFGVDSRSFACDPALTGAAKVRRLFAQAGVSICSLATDISFDAAVVPPVIGHLIKDQESSVRAAQRAVDLAAGIECPLVRVFGFRVPSNETHAHGSARIIDRLGKVLDHAAKTGVAVAIENGGSFGTSRAVLDLVNGVRSELLGVCYNTLESHRAGEHPGQGVAVLGGAVRSLRVKDVAGGRPCVLGAGEVPVRDAVAAAVKSCDGSGREIHAIFEWDRAWLPDIGEPEFALDHASRTLWQWIGAMSPASAPRAAIHAGAY